MGRALESGVSAGAATGIGLAKVSPGFRFWGVYPPLFFKEWGSC
jgi:hypothetical protein